MVVAGAKLKTEIEQILSKQGFNICGGDFDLPDRAKETLRQAHMHSKRERLLTQQNFIQRSSSLVVDNLIKEKLDIERIDPEIIEVKSGSKWETMFRWWSYMWWSLPYERPIGRQMRFVVWDKTHKSPIGLIGLQSPILSWAARDNYLSIPYENRDFWVNQSLNAQRLGALPPYNEVLGGKLVAMLMTSIHIRNAFKEKYKDKKTIMKNVQIPPRLLFITTAGAYGKTPVYNRLKFKGTDVAKFMDFTKGFGSFHISNQLYESIIGYLHDSDVSVKRGYGTGPSRKMRLIDTAMKQLGFKNGTQHTVQRGVYLFPFADNLREVIQRDESPDWYDDRTEEALTDFWKERWALPREDRLNQKVESFSGLRCVENLLKELN